jgi:beta-lactamase class D
MFSRQFILLAFTWSWISAGENFLLFDDTAGEMRQEFGDHLDQRVSPCSTFKIALSLMGFDGGILEDEDHPQWPYQEGYVHYLESWKADQTPRSWIKYSCVWYSQLLATMMGLEEIQGHLGRLNYGNQDMSGQMEAWLGSSLKISPREQLHFLQNLVREQLPFSKRAMQLTKKILFIEELPQGWKLFGKTGLCGGAPVVGWFVGWVEKEERVFVFVYNIQDQIVDPALRIPRVKVLLAESGIM